MSLFVDKVITKDDSAIQVDMVWHPHLGILARGEEGLLTQIKCRSSPNVVWFLLTASFSEDLGGVVNLVDKYGYDIDEGMIPRKLY